MRTKTITADADGRIGERVRAARMAAGLNQTELGAAAGISFQQIQKYEKGRDRISASCLQVLAKALGVPAASLLDPENGDGHDGDLTRLAIPRGAAALLRSFSKIQNETVRRKIVDLVVSVTAEFH